MPELPPLPIDALIPELLDALRGGNNAVVTAPPGAGKTTRIPPALLGEAWLRGIDNSSHAKIIILQPRRVAARAAAARIAQERGWRVGQEVGYHIRFENRTQPRTRIHVLTEGILTRRIQSDPFLDGVGCVILDEFHERGIHTDLALALLRELQSVRGDLRLIVMSATFDPAPVAQFLGAPGAPVPVFQSQGRLFPVSIEYQERADTSPVWERAAAGVRRMVQSMPAEAPTTPAIAASPAHILVFLPGIGEIRRTHALVKEHDADVHILHGSVSAREQDLALHPSARRKIILATNIAETSLTIDGVRAVVDSGLARVPFRDTRLGIDRLELRRVSRASAEQRAGRAGRTAPGRCLRLWTRAEDSALEPREIPEIHRVDLAATLLALHACGVPDPMRFGWFEPPREEAVRQAERLLHMLGAIDERQRLTDLGGRLARLPLHPRLGCMLLAGAREGVLREAATFAALLSERDILAAPLSGKRREAAYDAPSDLLERLEWIERSASSPVLDPLAAQTVERLRDELIQAVMPLIEPHK